MLIIEYMLTLYIIRMRPISCEPIISHARIISLAPLPLRSVNKTKIKRHSRRGLAEFHAKLPLQFLLVRQDRFQSQLRVTIIYAQPLRSLTCF